MVETESSRGVRPTWPLYLLFFLVAGVTGAIVSWGFLSESLAALGIPDPGAITTAGLPLLRAGAWLLAALAVGSFLFASFLTSPRQGDLWGARLTVDGVVAARTGAVSALCFALIAVVMVPLVLSDVSGQPFSAAVQPANWAVALSQVAAAKAWLLSAAFALLVGVPALFTHGWMWQPVWLVGSVLVVAPLGLSGHSAAGGDHDYGTNSLLWHVLFMMLWVGGLMALVAHGRRLGPGMVVAVRRYSTVAFVAMLVMVVSGVVNAAIRVRFEDLFTSDYGRVIVAKAVLTFALAVFGLWHRKVTLPKLVGGDQRAFLRVAVMEVVVMAATIGVAISLGRTPPPPPRVVNLSPMALIMGYDLTVEPTMWSVWTVWRLDIMFTAFGLLLTGAYLYGLYRLRKQGGTWPWHCTFWWLLGTVSLSVAMSSGIGLYMPAMFSMHMVAHMMLSMVIPVFLVLGAPLKLVLAVTAPNPAEPGVHEWVQALLHSTVLRFVFHPAVNTIQFLTFFYLLYITPWYDFMVKEHAGHLIMNWVFLVSGYVYYWDMIGADPKPRENTVMQRLAWLVFSMPVHLYFGVYLMQLSQILAEDFYRSLHLPWEIDLLHDQDVGGGIAWASGSFPLVVVFGALFMQWLKEDRKEAKQYDRHAEETDDADLEAYNQMLAAMNRHDS
ncbi:MAG: cytochrome c oxidase assembly protein [Corynebacterium sp.]|nr:cytochrome c oxidase assembly protein [Corynebacterium sp.]